LQIGENGDFIQAWGAAPVNERSSTGSFSRLEWGGEELLLQSEITHAPEPKITTLILAEGEVICRAEGLWRDAGSDQVAEQQRIGVYHDRLLRALRNLHSNRHVPAKELQTVFQRIVNIALRLISSPAADILATLPGAHWVMIVEADGAVSDLAPAGSPGLVWKDSTARFLYLSERLEGLFGGGPFTDISLRIPSGHILIAPQSGRTLVAEIEPDGLTAARAKLRDLSLGES
jgi:hypothetical protein